ncbi:hypothetical protein BegalDRAFT_0514 [Beggiatoa alba B18LD]|uniref:Uncharacterized protein n=1 Tax=Beggiatoa alba B18LD TaxID=395493 RepID=I3CCT9_9GAMM|nr:hypothetical protein [Beggiatoa alba]EIJ41432.1 hypothetical protein BegalDRAFT_0514 [Beggiatoa alba B18LD]
MRRYLLIAALSFAGMNSAYSAEFLCSYTARISAQDKMSSKGDSLVSGGKITPAIAAAVIRQDRANYHEFKKRDAEDETDCVFDDKQKRALLEKRLSQGTASSNSLKEIVLGTPLIKVDVYDEYVDVSIIEDQEPEGEHDTNKSNIN